MTEQIKLYDTELSGNCYKIRLFCSCLSLSYQIIPINLQQAEQKQAAFLQLNPRGQVPVLEDRGTLVWDSMAILVYLASKYADARWLPSQPDVLAKVMQWLALSENELLYGLARARAVLKFNRPWDLAECQALAGTGLAILEQHLNGHTWLAAEHVTIADIACFPYVALAPEAGMGLDSFPSVRSWLARVQSLPGYVAMPGIISYA